MVGKEGSLKPCVQPCTTKHMEAEEAVTGQEGPLKPCTTNRKAKDAVTGEDSSLNPCTTKHMTVTGEDGPLERCTTKREEDQVVADFSKAGKVAAIDGMLEQVKPLDAVQKFADEYVEFIKAPSGKYILPENYVLFILSLKRESASSFEHYSHLRSNNPVPQLLPDYEKLNDDLEKYQDQIRNDLKAKGYVEVDDDYFDNRAKLQALLNEEWSKIDFSRFEIATAADMEEEGFVIDYDEAKRRAFIS